MQIDWLPEEVLSVEGKLGLTNMPGNRQAVEKDLDELVADGVQHIVCLQKSSEFQEIRPRETVGGRSALIRERNMRFLHEPIGDFTTPTLDQAERTVLAINESLNAGETVVVHCFAGLGRAGTIAACVLVTRGYSAEEAVQLVRSYRKGAIQTMEQADFVAKFQDASK